MTERKIETKQEIKVINRDLANYITKTFVNGDLVHTRREIKANPATIARAFVIACAGRKPLVELPYFAIGASTLGIDEFHPIALWIIALTDSNSPGTDYFDDPDLLAKEIEKIDFWKYDEAKANEIRGKFQRGKPKVIVEPDSSDMELE